FVIHDAREGAPAQKLGDQVEQAGLGLAEVEDRDRVRVAQTAGGARLLLEACGGGLRRRLVGVDQLYRDVGLEQQVASAVDAAHFAGAEQLDELVLSGDGRAE